MSNSVCQADSTAVRLSENIPLKTNAFTAPPIGDRPVADTASRTPAETSRWPARTLESISPVLGGRPGMRPPTTAVRAPVRRLEQFSARHAPFAAPGATADGAAPPPLPAGAPARASTSAAGAVPATSDRDRADTDVAPAERPTAFGKLASGPKIDCMSDMLTSIVCLDDRQVSHITEALGLGPAAPGRARQAQLSAVGCLLRAPLYHLPPEPDSAAIERMPFGRGVPPDVLAGLVRAAREVNCFVSERQVTGRHGKTVNLLQVHLKNEFDAFGAPLASEPDSANHHAVRQLAMRFADALLPSIRTDDRQYQIEYVACQRAQGGSADVFTAHLSGQMQMAQRPASIKLTREHTIEATLRTSHLLAPLPAADREKLVRAAHVAHMVWDEEIVWDSRGNPGTEVRVMFDGMQNMRDVKQAFSSIGQSVGAVFKANHEAAVLVAQAIEDAHAKGRNVKFQYIAGGSMGGASAQLFAAAIESRVKLHDPAPLVLFDPQLPNQVQARHAIKGGKLGYDYARPRGIAVTLDYAERPRKSLMERMKGLGFKSPGLVWLKLGLGAHDRTRRLPRGETEQRPPVTSGPPGLGYHSDYDLYKAVLNRFTGG
jgi:hypothetical protein